MFRNDDSFTLSHVRRVYGSPKQHGSDLSEIEFYVEYPESGTMRQDILLMIMSVQLYYIEANTGLTLTLVQPDVPIRYVDENNSISVVLKNFKANKVCFPAVEKRK